MISTFIKDIQSKWTRKANLLLTLSFSSGLIFYALQFYYSNEFNITSTLGVFFLLLALIVIRKYYEPNLSKIESYTHKRFSKLEFSTHILQKPTGELNILEQIQSKKIKENISLKSITYPLESPHIFWTVLLTTILILIPLILLNQKNNEVISPNARSFGEIITAKTPTIVSFELKDVVAKITPPSYTKMKPIYTRTLNLNAPEKSLISWKFEFSDDPDLLAIILDATDTLFESSNSRVDHKANNSVIYQSVYQKDTVITHSQFYTLNLVEDKVPVAVISNIPEFQRLPFRSNYEIEFTVNCQDDYGLAEAYLVATIAKGSGESVKFRAKKYDLPKFNKDQNEYTGVMRFSTEEMGMEPGDEFYFYAYARDNCAYRNQWTKSITHFVILEDTTTYAYTEVSGMQLDIMPDFFRSQRQIIIDSEALLAEKSSIPISEFKKRSNELGFDQKQLRLKYGQFLGEEAESGIAIQNEVNFERTANDHDHDEPGHVHSKEEVGSVLDNARSVLNEFMHDHDHGGEGEGNIFTKKDKLEEAKNPTWVEELSHNHDNEEEATFFGLSLKSKLKAALTQMWDAELHLRLFHPKESLPYQYLSLKYLQEIKNHARIYVHRVGFDPPPIKETEKRLTGNQDEIIKPVSIEERKEKDRFDEIRKSLTDLQTLNLADLQMSETIIAQLKKAGEQVASIAINHPAILPILPIIQQAILGDTSSKNIANIIAAFQKILPELPSDVNKNKFLVHPFTKRVILNSTPK